MTKNKPVSEENKAAIREKVRQARKDGTPTLASIAAEYGIHPTMISKIAPTSVKAMKPKSPKRRTARKATKAVKANNAKPVYTEQDWDEAFIEYIAAREAYQVADKKLREIAKSL